MLNIFIDESGDQGFNFDKGSSRHFLIGFAYFPNTDYKNCIDLVKKQIAGYGGRGPKHLHFNKSSIEVRKSLLKLLVEKNGKFGYIYEDKQSIYEHLRGPSTINYNYNQMTYYLIENLIINEQIEEDITVHISQRSTDKNIKKGIADYLRKEVNKKLSPHKFYPRFVKSHNSRGADCADFICSSAFRYIEKNDALYYDIIKNNMVVTRKLFK